MVKNKDLAVPQMLRLAVDRAILEDESFNFDFVDCSNS